MTTALGFFLSDGALPFTIAAAVLAGLLVVEAIGIVFVGGGLSHIADALLPAHDADAGAHGLAEALLGWLHWGKVPALATFAMFLGGFAAAGWTVQWLAGALAGAALPLVLAVPAGIAGGLLGVRKLALPIMRILPRDQSTALSVDDMTGLLGEVTLPASLRSPGQARVRDRFGQVHYLRAVPAEGGAELAEGQRICVLRREGELFVVADPKTYQPELANEILSILEDRGGARAGADIPAQQKEKR